MNIVRKVVEPTTLRNKQISWDEIITVITRCLGRYTKENKELTYKDYFVEQLKKNAHKSDVNTSTEKIFRYCIEKILEQFTSHTNMIRIINSISQNTKIKLKKIPVKNNPNLIQKKSHLSLHPKSRVVLISFLITKKYIQCCYIIYIINIYILFRK